VSEKGDDERWIGGPRMRNDEGSGRGGEE